MMKMAALAIIKNQLTQLNYGYLQMCFNLIIYNNIIKNNFKNRRQ